jgi:hypothetical protein
MVHPCAAPAARHPLKGAMPAAWQSQFRGILEKLPCWRTDQLFARRLSQRISAPSPGSFSYSSSAASQ